MEIQPTVVEISYKKMLEHCCFKLYRTPYIFDYQQKYLYIIAICDKETGLIIGVTDYADYAFYLAKSEHEAFSINEANLYAVVQFLNYVMFESYDKYRITSIYEIKKDMVQEYLNHYSSTLLKIGKYPSKNSVHNKRTGICTFLENVVQKKGCKMKYLKPNQLMTVHKGVTKNGDYFRNKYVNFKVGITYYDKEQQGLNRLLRDMPIDIANRFIEMAEIYAPDLLFAIILLLYAGLRIGDLCNVRRKESCYGPGVIPEYVTVKDSFGNKVVKCLSFELDLTKEYVLRNDGVSVGRIKREKPRRVHSKLVPIVFKYYTRHIKRIEDLPCEESKPMFLNKNKEKKTGLYRAMTKGTLRDRLNRLYWNYVLPSCADDPNPDLALYYLRMQRHSWGTEDFRHWYTVFLMYIGVDDTNTLMELRGDSSPESAYTYLRNKKWLMNRYGKTLEKWGQMIKGGN